MTLEFALNEEASVNLSELRFHIPSSEQQVSSPCCDSEPVIIRVGMMWTLLKHSRSRYLVVLHVRCSASKTLRVVLHLGGEEGQHWHNKHWRAHCYLQRDHLPVSKGKVTLKLVLELGF